MCNNKAEYKFMVDMFLLHPLSLQQKIQKYSSRLLSHLSNPKPFVTIASSKPHGPNPHSLFIEKPFSAKIKYFSENNFGKKRITIF